MPQRLHAAGEEAVDLLLPAQVNKALAHPEAGLGHGLQHPALAQRVVQQQAGLLRLHREGIDLDIAIREAHLGHNAAAGLVQIHPGLQRAANHAALQPLVQDDGVAAHQGGQQLAGYPRHVAAGKAEHLFLLRQHHAGQRAIGALHVGQLTRAQHKAAVPRRQGAGLVHLGADFEAVTVAAHVEYGGQRHGLDALLHAGGAAVRQAEAQRAQRAHGT